MECSVCGISGEKTRLFDVISPKGIIKICDGCLEEDMPILRRPTTFQLKEAEKKSRMYPREPEKNSEEAKAETTLKDIADRNYEKAITKEKRLSSELVDNFHWIIMRVRRMKKLTQEQLAKEISESTAAIKMAEKGILPEDDYRLVNKFESFLGIKIIKDEARDKIARIPQKQPARVLRFDKEAMQNLTIADLKKMKEEREKPVEELGEKEKKDEEEAEVL